MLKTQQKINKKYKLGIKSNRHEGIFFSFSFYCLLVVAQS